LKISVLIAQYFYQNKVLNLPGIGSFYLDEAIDVQSIGNKSDLLEHIHYAQKTINRPDDPLIEFIRKHTGKIKPLAESDLDTFVADGKLMLNIGKPFHIEGVGTLQKNKEGEYQFTPGAPVVQRLEPLPALPVQEWEKEKPVKMRSVFDESSYETPNNNRRIIIGAGIVVGLIIIIWGGYSVYSSKTDSSGPSLPSNNTTASTANTTQGDTTSRVSQYVHNLDSPAEALEKVIKKDSVLLDEAAVTAANNANAATTNTTTTTTNTTSTAPAVALPAGPSKKYKFVLETFTRKTSAVKRYNLLKPRVELESVDSTLFKIVISLPGSPADTARQKDSLHNWYWGPRTDRQVTIEQ
jgi:hypothetical protein